MHFTEKYQLLMETSRENYGSYAIKVNEPAINYIVCEYNASTKSYKKVWTITAFASDIKNIVETIYKNHDKNHHDQNDEVINWLAWYFKIEQNI